MKIVISLVASLALMTVVAAAQSAQPPRIGIVQTPDEFDGTGCRLQLPFDWQSNDRLIFASNADEDAVMNIDDTDVWMHRVALDVGEGDNGRVVDRYRKDDIEVEVDFVVTKRCHPSDESCEVTWFDAVITVKRGQLQQTVSTKGICGS